MKPFPVEAAKYIADEQAMLTLAAQIAQHILGGTIIFLVGDLGVGKTTFTRGFLQALGYHGKVKSPTYTLVEPYHLAAHTIYHFDLYRLLTAHELKQIGIQEYFTDESISLIEWPEKGSPLLPTPDLLCQFEFAGTGRELKLIANTARGKAIIQQLL